MKRKMKGKDKIGKKIAKKEGNHHEKAKALLASQIKHQQHDNKLKNEQMEKEIKNSPSEPQPALARFAKKTI